MKVAVFSGLLLCAALSGCATYPQNQEDQATYYVNEAKSSMGKDNCIGAANFIEAAISRPTGNAKVKAYLQTDQRATDCYSDEQRQ